VIQKLLVISEVKISTSKFIMSGFTHFLLLILGKINLISRFAFLGEL